MLDWLQIGLQVLAPIAIGGVIWLYVQIYSLRTDYELSKNTIAGLQSSLAAQNDIPGRVIKLETTIPYMIQSTDEVKKMLGALQASVQRIEVSVAKSGVTS